MKYILTANNEDLPVGVNEQSSQSVEILIHQVMKGDTGATGPTGPQGPKGDTGNDGVSPTVSTSKSGKTTTITIVDAQGTHTATVLDGDDASVTKQAVESVLTGNITSHTHNQYAESEDLAEVATSGDYEDLENKPTLPTKTSDLSNDSGFVTKAVSDLTNYYLKSETYTQAEVNTLISAITRIEFVVASVLPTASASTLNKIYLIPSASQKAQNVKDEFITIDNGAEAQTRYTWEQIGSTAIDLSNYYTKSETDSAISGHHDSTKINEAPFEGTNGQVLTTDGNGGRTWTDKMQVVNDTTHTDTDKALSANMGKELQTEINNLKNIGRFLAIWDASTGLPTSNPITSPYTYKVGDYYRVGEIAGKYKHTVQFNGEAKYGRPFTCSFVLKCNNASAFASTQDIINALVSEGYINDSHLLDISCVIYDEGYPSWCGTMYSNNNMIVFGASFAQGYVDTSCQVTIVDTVTGGLVNYKPNGSTYTIGVASTTVETGILAIGDIYYYDGSSWTKQESSGGGKVQDVQINGTSILSSGIANIPIAQNAGACGAVYLNSDWGVFSTNTGVLRINKAADSQIENKQSEVRPLVPANLDKAIKEGLGNYNLGTGGANAWSDAYKSHAREVIGAQSVIDSSHKLSYTLLSDTPSIPSKTSELTNDSCFLTSHQSLDAYRTSAAQDVIDATKASITDLESGALVPALAKNIKGLQADNTAKFIRRTTAGSVDVEAGVSELDEIKGNSIVWNQLVDENTSSVTIPSGHKYLFRNSTLSTTSIITSDGSAISVVGGSDVVIDLTQEFGAGNEPSTVAEFEALYGKSYYPYNNGQVLHNIVANFVTNGFNQWDEEWELGVWLFGEKVANDSYIRSKYLIPVLPNSSYYYCLNTLVPDDKYLVYECFDANKNYVSRTTVLPNSLFIIPSDIYYIAFYPNSSYGNTYNHDICINLSHSGDRNGQYEPHWESRLPLNLTTIKGKLNGTGNSVTIFPEGMAGKGTAYDSIVTNENGLAIGAWKRFWKVDLGSLEWSKIDKVPGTYPYGVFYAAEELHKRELLFNYICTKGYEPHENFETDKSLRGLSGNSIIYIVDSTYSDSTPAEFKAAMQGVELWYELSSPEYYVLDEPFETYAKVDDYGMEWIEPIEDNQGNPITAPFSATIKYGINVADTVKNLPHNYRTKEAQDVIDAGKQDLIDSTHKLDNSLVGLTVVTTNPATLEVCKLYDLGEQSSLALVLPSSASLGDFIIVDFLSGDTATTLSITSSAGMSEYDLVPETNKIYELYFRWAKIDSSNYGWVIKYSEATKATV